MFQRIWRAFLRFAFHHFYNTFAFTYDLVSVVVSRGHWRAWTDAAIPFIVGKRVLEMPCGTGNLLIDMRASGHAPIGVDLSPAMLRITQDKLRKQRPERSHEAAQSKDVPLLRARAQALPFVTGSFDSITMTFPPGFVSDPKALAELHRVLRDDGRWIWVDGGRLLPIDWYSRILNWALNAVSGSSEPFARFASETLEQAGFQTKIKTVQNEISTVMIVTAMKRSKDG